MIYCQISYLTPKIALFFLIQFFHPGVYGSDKEKDLTGGFSVIKYKGEGKNEELVYLFDYEKMKELYKDFLQDTTNGVTFNETLMKIITRTLNAGINHQLDKLKGCMGGDYLKKIEDKVKTGEIELRFDDNNDTGFGYHQKKKIGTKENVTLSGSYLKKIISDITSSIRNNVKWYPDNIYTLPWYKDFLTDIGHEMIHSHADIGAGHENECIAHNYGDR